MKKLNRNNKIITMETLACNRNTLGMYERAAGKHGRLFLEDPGIMALDWRNNLYYDKAIFFKDTIVKR